MENNEPKYVYMLEAKGNLTVFGSSLHFERSSTVFTTREKAEKRLERFKELVTDPNRLYQLDPETVEVSVKPLEIVE